jgi:hypothetical protein
VPFRKGFSDRLDAQMLGSGLVTELMGASAVRTAVFDNIGDRSGKWKSAKSD